MERIFGEGDLVQQGRPVLRAGYQLAVYREWSDRDGELSPGAFVVDGHVMAPPEALHPWLFTADPLTLHLADGRLLDLYIVSDDGAVSGAGEQGPRENET